MASAPQTFRQRSLIRQHDRRRSQLAFATVASSETQAREVLDAVERFVWSFPEVEVVDSWRRWVDDEED